MKLLSINDGHNASVAVYVDGKIIFSLSEERVSRKKNFYGIPVLAINEAMTCANLNSLNNFDAILIYRSSYVDFLLWKYFNNKDIFGKITIKIIDTLYNLIPTLIHYLDEHFPQYLIKKYYSNILTVDISKIHLVNHHEAHAHSALINLDKSKEHLIFTLDAEGDLESGSIWLFQNSKLIKLRSIKKNASLGHLYGKVTKYLGMKPNEHEFKVMGLEPYSKKSSDQFIYSKKTFHDLFIINNLNIKCKINTNSKKLEKWFFNKFKYIRFDNIAGGLQKALEEIVLKWITDSIEFYKVRNIAVSGGVFMNVKLNQRINELDQVKDFYVCPSSGDETTVWGCIHKYCHDNNWQIKRIDDLYLGSDFNENQISGVLAKIKNNSIIKIYRPEDIEHYVANLLAEGEIVARFNGREEFGARSLGNRSILAHPKYQHTIDHINKIIKDRDFWMPFTPSVLEEESFKVIHNPKKIYSPYMAITFSTTEFATNNFSAAIHPYDKTMRIQMVREKWNPSYYKVLSHFFAKTGIPGILNTSFNLHGEPNVHFPDDAIKTLLNSGLNYLAIGEYMVEKIKKT